MTTEEMQAVKMSKNEDGFWISTPFKRFKEKA